MGKKRLELTGRKFNRLTVIDFAHIDKSGQTCWLCKCDCGNEKIIRASYLRSGDTKSCGCLKKEIDENRTLPEGIAACNIVLSRHKAQAKERNLEQALTDEQIIELHKGNCHYCGAPPSQTWFRPRNNGSYIYNGIDRVDNNKGYTIMNTVSCCWNCNKAKDTQTYDEFLSHIKRIHSHLNLDA